MNQIEALQKLQRLGAPVFETRDAAALLAVTTANANVILKRLARQGMLTHLARGRWLLGREVARFTLPELISAPYPAYVSLQSALFHHGLIEQVPAVTYAVTLGRPRRVTTPLGTISYHRMPPELFTGFELDEHGAKIATSEKALFDVLYLSPARSRLFAKLPELELPRDFRWSQLREYARSVAFDSRRAHIERRIRETQRACRR
jgi:predicted transcriptional regulator of viral defense system